MPSKCPHCGNTKLTDNYYGDQSQLYCGYCENHFDKAPKGSKMARPTSNDLFQCYVQFPGKPGFTWMSNKDFTLLDALLFIQRATTVLTPKKTMVQVFNGDKLIYQFLKDDCQWKTQKGEELLAIIRRLK